MSARQWVLVALSLGVNGTGALVWTAWRAPGTALYGALVALLTAALVRSITPSVRTMALVAALAAIATAPLMLGDGATTATSMLSTLLVGTAGALDCIAALLLTLQHSSSKRPREPTTSSKLSI
jgi:hypothetical protein